MGLFISGLIVSHGRADVTAPPASSSATHGQDNGADSSTIKVGTEHWQLVLRVKDQRLAQINFGPTAQAPATNEHKSKSARDEEFYPAGGSGYIWDPAIMAAHADGNTSTDLQFVHQTQQNIDSNVTETRVELKDPQYPFFVTLVFRTYRAEDVLEQWSEIHHDEAGPITLSAFASSSPVFRATDYYLTQFPGDYRHEMNLVEEKLSSGTKVLESRLGTRAHYYRNPSFLLALGGPASEDSGEVFGGTLAWSGSFKLAFEQENGRLRALCGMNPYDSNYRLQPNTIFKTPGMLWSYSSSGKGQISRNFHRWARRYALHDGDKPRPILFNNWEATEMRFDQSKIVSLLDGAKAVGAELFLLDDGWFGNSHPRDNDHAGLGDWQPNYRKLPGGIGYLADEAQKRGLRFGIWVEPEMVNPDTDLFQKHPDWVIRQPNRELDLFRNQAVLDLSRPAVRQFVFEVLDDLLTKTPGISYVKWDCNRYITQPGSAYLAPQDQQNLWIDYTNALYDVMERVSARHPHVQMMVCSGGGGRVDYGSMRYFDGFWPSDNTDPVARIKIQWGYSHFFPAAATADHVTRMGNRPLKFAFDVAMSGCLGMDMDLSSLTPAERQFCASAVAEYTAFRDVIMTGDLYRLQSPYENHARAALMYVAPDRRKAMLFVYQLKDADSSVSPLLLNGLDPDQAYAVREVNLMPGDGSQLTVDGKRVDGSSLMNKGLSIPPQRAYQSWVIELANVAR
jgi:alpha-galactosidase